MREVLFEVFLNMVVPPKNNRYLTGKSGRFLPERIATQIDDAIIILKSLKNSSGLKTIQEPVKVKVCFVLGNKVKRDLDNMFKSIGDCLVKAEVISDDSLIVEKEVEKVLSKRKEFGTLIQILKSEKKEIDIPLDEFAEKFFCKNEIRKKEKKEVIYNER